MSQEVESRSLQFLEARAEMGQPASPLLVYAEQDSNSISLSKACQGILGKCFQASTIIYLFYHLCVHLFIL